MKIAILGYGNIGRPTFDLIYNKQGLFFQENDIEIKYVLIKSLTEASFSSPIFVTNFDIIEADPEVQVVMEIMGARISYDFIKRALIAKKHVITANKEVVANHFTELEDLAKSNNVKFLFEASVGGGIPIITALMNNTNVNNIYRIEGILNGTTNFILTSMHKEKIAFDDALKIAQKKGFAEADPTADLEGLDMVRKIAILSQIAYHGEVSIDKVYSFGISKLTKEFIAVSELLGYTLKFIASSEIKDGKKVNISVEPTLLKTDDLVANVNYEYNIIRYYGLSSGTQMMYGKGAGPITANALVNDLALLVSGYNSYIESKKELDIIGNNETKSKYLIQLKGTISEAIIEKNLNGFVITNEISGEKLISLLPKIQFYAKIY